MRLYFTKTKITKLLLLPTICCLLTACPFSNPEKHKSAFFIYHFKDSADYSGNARVIDRDSYEQWLLRGSDTNYYIGKLDKPLPLDSGYYIVMCGFGKNNVYLKCSIDEWNNRQIVPHDSLFLTESPYSEAYMCIIERYETSPVCEHIKIDMDNGIIYCCDTDWFNDIIINGQLNKYFTNLMCTSL